jgi:hypothetical protein
MNKITIIALTLGFIINVSAQEKSKNLSDVFKAEWLIGSWERKNNEGKVVRTVTFGWKIKDVLMFKENKSSSGEVGSFSLISLEKKTNDVLYHSFHSDGYVSVGKLKTMGEKVLRTANWSTKKLTTKEMESMAESYSAEQLAAGKIKKEELAKFRNETLQNLKKRKTSGTNAYIWKNAGPDKMLSTQVFKNESGAYVETDDSWTEISTRVSE